MTVTLVNAPCADKEKGLEGEAWCSRGLSVFDSDVCVTAFTAF